MAQQPAFQQYHTFKKNDQVSIRTTMQDSNGFIWIGTEQGLLRFDGQVRIPFTISDSIAYTNVVTALAQDSLGRLWIGSKSGRIHYLEDGKVKPFEPKEGHAVKEVSNIVFDSEGNLWFSTLNDGLYYYKEERLYRLDEEEGMPDIFVYDLWLDTEGNIWAGTDGGIALCKWKGDSIAVEVIDYKTGLPDNIIKQLVLGRDSTLWLGTEDAGIVRIRPEGRKITIPSFSKEWEYGAVTGIIEKENQLWIGTQRKGLVVVDLENGQKRNYMSGDGLPTSRINALSLDSEGNTWIATPQGLLRTLGNEVESLNDLGMEAGSNVIGLDMDTKGTLWFLTENGCFRRTRSGRKYQVQPLFTENDAYKQLTFISLFVDNSDRVWLGTYGNGLLLYDPKTGKSTLLQEELNNGNILNITGKGDRIWLATLGGGTALTVVEGKITDIVPYGQKEGLSTNYIYQAFTDSRGRTWLGTDGEGVAYIETGQVKVLPKDMGLSDKVVYGFAEDAKGQIWINTLEEGLFCYDGKQVRNFDEKDGLRDLDIAGIIADIHGNIVIAHSQGIDIYDPVHERFYYIGDEFGIQDKKPNLNAIAKGPMGNVLIGTEKGIIQYSDITRQVQGRPFTYIEGIKLFGEPVKGYDENPSFSYQENNITIDYIGFWYLNPEALRFRYRLEGYESAWIPSKNRAVTYSNLPPGEYNFRIQASHNGNFDKSQEDHFSFEIRKPYWQTLWFYGICILLSGLLLYLYIRWRVRKLNEDKRILEQSVEERTKELQAAFKDIEEKNDNIVKSINYAKRIQNAILPLKENIGAVFENYFILYRPRDIVSGDFYWFHKGEEGRYYFAAIDCTGHGVPGAIMSMIGFSLLNEIVAAEPGILPARLLGKLHQGVVNALKQETAKNGNDIKSNDGMDVALCRWCPSTRTLLFSGAKRPLYKIDKTGQLTEQKGDKISIGGRKKGKTDQLSFSDHTIPVETGDRIYLFSDGYPDQFGGPDNKKFMNKKLKRLLSTHCQDSPEQQKKVMEEALDTWKKGYPQTDDILLMGIFF